MRGRRTARGLKESLARRARARRPWERRGDAHKVERRRVQGTYVDKKCPFTGNVSIRGRILKGVVISTKMHRSVVIRREYLHYIKKYRRFEKRHTNLTAHVSPCFRVKEGDVVVVGECRPLSKTIRFNVVKVEKSSERDGGKSFRAF
jgi:small subunit ribosomal protein S11e